MKAKQLKKSKMKVTNRRKNVKRKRYGQLFKLDY